MDLTPFYAPEEISTSSNSLNSGSNKEEKEECPTVDQISSAPVAQLKQVVRSWGSARQTRELEKCVEKADLMKLATEVATATGESIDLS